MALIHGTNQHTTLFARAIRQDADAFRPRTVRDIVTDPAAEPLPTRMDPVLGIELAAQDDVNDALTSNERFKAILAKGLPISDPNHRWTNQADAAAAVRELFPGLLRRTTRWEDPMGDRALEFMVTQGIGAHLLKRDTSGDGWAIDLSWMEQCEMRPSFHPFGGRIRLTPELKLRDIWYGDQVATPSQGQAWEKAKLIMRASIAAEVTIVRHAVHCHFIVNNCGVVATRRSLGPRHPLRRLLLPFQYRGPTINHDAALLLIPKGAIFHRLFGFTWKGLQRVYRHALAAYVQETFPENLRRRGVHGLRHGYPFGEDGLRYWKSVRGFVVRYFDAVGFGETVLNDKGVAAWLRDLQAVSPAKIAPSNRDDLINLIAHQLFNSTAWHEHTGGAIGDYLSHIGFAGLVVRKAERFEDMLPSKNTMIQAYMLGVLTGYRMPGLLEDWSIAMIGAQPRALVQEWQHELLTLSHAIDRSNASRPQPCTTFNPRYLELSVSI